MASSRTTRRNERSAIALLLLCAAARALAGCGGSETETVCADPADCGDPQVVASEAEQASLPFTPSNIGAISVAGPLGDLVLDDDCGQINFNEGEAGCVAPGGTYQSFEVTQDDGSKMMVFVAQNIRIASGAAIHAFGNEPVALVAIDTMQIDGLLDASADGGAPGAGGFGSPLSDGGGLGPGGGLFGQNSGGASYCGRGGEGTGPGPGKGGATYGSPELAPIYGGSSGGGMFSGGGGGALQLVAGKKLALSLTGAIDVGGGGGDWNGGGSGGALLIEAPEVVIAGVVAANGGGGSAGTGGIDGQNADASSTPARGGTGSTAGTDGGDGGAGTSPDGTVGGFNAMTPDGSFSGSPGGGAGRIRINTSAASASITGTVSPALSTSCATQGTIAP